MGRSKHRGAGWLGVAAALLLSLWCTQAWSQAELPPELSPPLLGWLMQGVPLEELAGEWPVFGALRGEVDVQHDLVSSSGVIYDVKRVTGDAVRWGEVPLGRLTMVVSRPQGGRWSTVTLTVEESDLAERIDARVQVPAEPDLIGGAMKWGQGALGGSVSIRGLDLGYASLYEPELAMDGLVDLDVTLSGRLADVAVEARVQGQGLAWRGEPVGEVVATWRHARGVSEVDARWGPQERPIGTAKLVVPARLDVAAWDVTWVDGGMHDVDVQLKGLTAQRLRPFWRAPAAADFVLDVSLRGSGSLDTLDLVGEVAGTLKDRDQPPLPVKASVRVRPREQVMRATLGESMVEVDVTTRAPLVRIRRAGARWAAVRVEGALGLELPLATLGPYLPGEVYDPRGLLTGNVAVKGTLEKPDFQGRIATRDVDMTVVALNQRLRSVDLQGRIAKDTLVLDAFDASTGQGTVRGRGKVRWRATTAQGGGLWESWAMDSNLVFALDDVPFVHATFPNGLIDGLVELWVDAAPEQVSLRAKVVDTGVRLHPGQLPRARAIPTNRAIEVVSRGEVRRLNEALFGGEGRLSADIDLTEPIHVQGEGVDLKLGGRLQIERGDTEAEVTGGFDVIQGGRFTLFGNRFTVHAGRITLRGGDLREGSPDEPEMVGSAADDEEVEEDVGEAEAFFDHEAAAEAGVLEPVIDFRARGVAVDTHILVKVRGPARRPELVLVSSPPLPAYQILTLMITGRLDAVDDTNGEVRRQVAQLINQFHNPGLSRQLYDQLGVDRVGLGFGPSVSQPILTVGKQLNRKLYVETTYYHSAPPDANEKEVHVEYRLDPAWTLDTIYGDAAYGSVGIFWQTRFGGDPPTAPPEDWGIEPRP